MNEYEERQAAKQERLFEAAERAEGQAQAANNRAHGILDVIPMGQPILVGHHSEGRHRRDLAKADNAIRQAIDQTKHAEELRYRAQRVGKGGISSDDPDAVDKLKAKLEKLEQAQELMKQANAQYKRGGWGAVDCLPEKMLASAKRTLELCPYHGRPFPSYALQNNNGNMRRIRERIQELGQRETEPAEAIEGNGYTLEENTELNRIMFFFDGKPNDDIRHTLKSHGFRWAPSNGAWQRQLNANGRYAAEQVRQFIETVNKFEEVEKGIEEEPSPPGEEVKPMDKPKLELVQSPVPEPKPERPPYVDTVEVAKMIREDLKYKWPRQKFSVKSSRYSGGSSINVKWIDGPTRKAVESVIGSYAGSSFDGMIDLKTGHYSRFTRPNGTELYINSCADYVFCDRDNSPEVYERAARQVCERHGVEYPGIKTYSYGGFEIAENPNVNGEWLATWIWRELQNIDMYRDDPA